VLPGPTTAPGVPNFIIRKFRVPPFLLPIYQAAGVEYGVRWEILAAINEIETDYGRNLHVSSAGAVGWMQFLPSSWKRFGVDANRDGRRDPYNPVDAIFSAAHYLDVAGFADDPRGAVFAYNHADWYVTKVLAIASTYEATPQARWGGGPAPPPNDDVAAIAIQFAYNQLGKPYVWGAEGDNFYDCSGLMQRAYKEAGIQLPRTSREQWYAGARVLDPGHLQPGDLVFGAKNLSDPSTIYHVGMYIGAGNMIVAPYTGAVVRIQPMIRNDYIGAVRPTAAA
jgi:hypothetical protein